MKSGKTSKLNVQRSGAAHLPCFIFSQNLVRVTLSVNMSAEKHVEAVFPTGQLSCLVFSALFAPEQTFPLLLMSPGPNVSSAISSLLIWV